VSKTGAFDLRPDNFAKKKRAPKSTGSFSRCFRCLSPEKQTKLLHHDLATRIERALYADALAFELGNVGLVVDVVGLPGIILQHVLVALLHNRSREGLCAAGCVASCGAGGRAIGRSSARSRFRSGRIRGLRLRSALRRRRLSARRRRVRRLRATLRSALRRRRLTRVGRL
jgi:hypothetical protein